MLGKGFSITGQLGTGTRKVVTVTRLTEFKKYLDNEHWHVVGFLGLSYAGPGVELQ